MRRRLVVYRDKSDKRQKDKFSKSKGLKPDSLVAVTGNMLYTWTATGGVNSVFYSIPLAPPPPPPPPPSMYKKQGRLTNRNNSAFSASSAQHTNSVSNDMEYSIRIHD